MMPPPNLPHAGEELMPPPGLHIRGRSCVEDFTILR